MKQASLWFADLLGKVRALITNQRANCGLKGVFSVTDKQRAATTEESGTVLRSPRQNPTEAELDNMTTECNFTNDVTEILSLMVRTMKNTDREKNMFHVIGKDRMAG